MGTNITVNYFEFGVNRYFRGNAHIVKLGTCGEKKDPIGPKAYIDPELDVAARHLVGRVQKGQPVTIDWSREAQADVEIDGLKIKVYGVNTTTAAEFSYERLRTAQLKLINFWIDEGSLKTILNTDADTARSYLAREGSDGRIVSEVWVVMSAELGDHFAGSGSLSVSVDGTDTKITASGGAKGTQSIVLSKGAVFAFKMHKVTKWNSGKTRIEDMEADYKGFS
jgi:hypothetical protein